MNASDRSRKDADAAPQEPDVAKIIPFPRGGRAGRDRSEVGWAFTADIRGVAGLEGEWLRRELASVVRDLLTWARDDMINIDGEHQGETGRAA